jgi:hypothetical protein
MLNSLTLLSATGEPLWESFEPGVVGGSGGTLVFGSDGRLYVNASAGLQAIDTATGARFWQKSGTRGQPLIDAHNRIIVVCNSGANLCAVDANGQTLWMEQTGYAVYGTPLIDANGTIVAAGNHRLTAFNSDGTTRWSHTLSSSGFVFEPHYPVVLDDGTIYLPWANRSVLVAGTGRGLAPSGWPARDRDNKGTRNGVGVTAVPPPAGPSVAITTGTIIDPRPAPAPPRAPKKAALVVALVSDQRHFGEGALR